MKKVKMDETNLHLDASSNQWADCSAKTTCYGCDREIKDKHVFRVAPDLKWHTTCLKCVQCHKQLDETCTCFVRDKKAYCKTDYQRIFGTKCEKCNEHINQTDYVMRIHDTVYHKDCFQCSQCFAPLLCGQKFSFRDNNLYCKNHLQFSSNIEYSTERTFQWPQLDHQNSSTSISSNEDERQSYKSVLVHNGHQTTNKKHLKKSKKDKLKTTRIRTVLNEKQLQMLRSCYAANPRPDALLKEQLVELTALSPRVIRVWFQNKRCKDKKRQIANQIEQEQKCNAIQINRQSTNGLFPDLAIRNDFECSQAAENRLDLLQSTSNWHPKGVSNVFFNSAATFRNESFGFQNETHDNAQYPYANYQSCSMSYSSSSPFDGDIHSISPQLFNSDLSSPTCSD